MTSTKSLCGMLFEKLFDKIFVINLPKRSDKRRSIYYKLSQFGLDENSDYEIFPAIDGTAPIYDDMYDRTDHKKIKTRGALGLVLTYAKLFDYIKNDDYSRILILEDDINFHKNTSSMMDNAKNMITDADSHDVLWLGANQLYMNQPQIESIITNNMYYTDPIVEDNRTHTFGAFALVLTKSCVDKNEMCDKHRQHN